MFGESAANCGIFLMIGTASLLDMGLTRLEIFDETQKALLAGIGLALAASLWDALQRWPVSKRDTFAGLLGPSGRIVRRVRP